MERSVVLVSGGMDSAVAAAIAAENGSCAFLHVNYGQRTEERELSAFRDLARHFRVKKTLVVDISHLKTIGGSALTDPGIEVPEGDLSRKGIPATYVPFRNAHLLSMAVSWAEVIGAREVCIGAVEEDGPGYPDCRESFFRAFEEAVAQGTRPGACIKIVTPLIHMKKSDIILKGAALGVPFHLTWSCYKNQKTACGTCDSCLLRLAGFKKAALQDPIPYERIPA